MLNQWNKASAYSGWDGFYGFTQTERMWRLLPAAWTMPFKPANPANDIRKMDVNRDINRIFEGTFLVPLFVY